MGFVSNEKANLENDVKAAYGYIEKNWKRMLGWYAAYYAAQHMSPAAYAKIQAILKASGISG